MDLLTQAEQAFGKLGDTVGLAKLLPVLWEVESQLPPEPPSSPTVLVDPFGPVRLASEAFARLVGNPPASDGAARRSRGVLALEDSSDPPPGQAAPEVVAGDRRSAGDRAQHGVRRRSRRPAVAGRAGGGAASFGAMLLTVGSGGDVTRPAVSGRFERRRASHRPPTTGQRRRSSATARVAQPRATDANRGGPGAGCRGRARPWRLPCRPAMVCSVGANANSTNC